MRMDNEDKKQFETIESIKMRCSLCEGVYVSKRVVERCPYCKKLNRQPWVEEALETQEYITDQCISLVLNLMDSRTDYIKKLKDTNMVMSAIKNIVNIKKLCDYWRERPENFVKDLISLAQSKEAIEFQKEEKKKGNYN